MILAPKWTRDVKDLIKPCDLVPKQMNIFNHRVPDNCHDAIPLLRFNTWLYSCCVLLFPYAHLNFKTDPNACLIVNKIQFCDIFEEYNNTSSVVIFVHTNVQYLHPII